VPTVPSGVDSVALWLGSSERPLFAWLDLPDNGLVAGAAILCPTMGLEAAFSARALRDLARRLAGAGWAVLRVDYAGTGDSAGTLTDTGLVAEWRRGIRGAVDYACQLGAPRIAVVGLRVGATLAAAELASGGGVDDVVLWDPCATGRAFLREQRALWAFLGDQANEGEVWGSTEVSEEGSVEAPGVVFSAATVSELEPLAVPSDANLASRELVLARKGRRLGRGMAGRLELPHVESEEVEGQEVLLDVDAVTPEATLDRIVSWLTVPGGPVVPIERPHGWTTAVHRMEGRPAVLERPLTIGPAGLFGILSEREVDPAPGAPTVVFLNAGRIGHHGPARLWVDLARSWAAQGLRCLRVDLSGIGDSPTRPGRTELVEFPADALEDLADVQRVVTDARGGEVVLVGLCSGGYHAIEAAFAAPIASVSLINPAITYYRFVQHPARRFEPNQAHRFDDREGWGATRPFIGKVLERLAPARDAALRVPGSWWVMKRWFVTSSPARTFDRLVRSGVDVQLIAGTGEARKLCRGEEGRYRSLGRTRRFSMEVLPHLEHTLMERTGRERVTALLHAHVARRVPGTAGAANPGSAP
jgi:alpha-beta hydrolase superfamily lysophospholipase